MRKVKLLALLLAALMVVAAFAGCANTEDIEKDVADLDERVTALEGKIDANQKANEEQIKALTALVEALTKSQEDIKGSVEANKTAQDESNKAILDAINGLKDQIAKVEKDQADADKEAADKEAAEKEAAEKAEAEAKKNAEELAAAQKTASDAIGLEAAARARDEKNYFVDDYAGLVKLLQTAQNDVTAAKTAAEVLAVMEKFNADLAKYVAIDDQLYAYFDTLWGGMTEANRQVNEDAQDLMKLARDHYAKLVDEGQITINGVTDGDDLAISDVPVVVNYIYGTAKDGSNLKVNLPAMFALIDDVYNKGETSNVTFLAADYDEIETFVEVYSLAKAVKEAKKIDASIKDFVENEAYVETYKFLMQTVYTNFADLNVRYEAWLKYVLPLSEDNLALLTLAEKMEHVKDVVDNYVAAVKALLELGEYSYTQYGKDQAFENLFLANEYDVFANDADKKFYADYDGNKKYEYATEAIFAPIDAIIAEWKGDFNLLDADVVDIIEEKLAVEFDSKVWNASTKKFETVNRGYAFDKAYAAAMDAKYAAFEKDIVKLIETMNEQDAIEVDAYEAYENLAEGYGAWKSTPWEFQAAGAQNKIKTVLNDKNFEIMVTLSGVIKAEKWTANKVTNPSNNDPLQLVVFKYPVVFTETTTTLNRADNNDVLRSFFAVAAQQNVIPVSEKVEADGLAHNYAWFKVNIAKPIVDRFLYEEYKFNNRNLFSTKDLLALADKMVELGIDEDNDGNDEYLAYVDRDHTLLALQDNGQFVFNKPGKVKAIDLPALVTWVGGEPVVDATKKVPYSINKFSEMCVDWGFDGLAEVLTRNAKIDELLAKFDERIDQLEADGAILFQELFAKVDYVELDTDAISGAMRTATTTYGSGTNTMYYVTLAEYSDFTAAQKVLKDWINLKGGNVAYKKMVDHKIETAIGNVYTAQVYQYVIGDGNYEKYENMQGQFVVLNKAMTDLKQHFAQLAIYANPKFGDTGLHTDVVYSQSVKDKNGNYTDTVYFTGYNTKSETKAGVTLETLIKQGFEKYAEFEALNAYRGCDVCETKEDLAACKAKQVLYVKQYETATWDNIDYFVLVYVKDAIYDAFEAKLSTTGKADADVMINMYMDFVKDAKYIYGQIETAIEYSPYNYVAKLGDAADFAVTITGTDDTTAIVAMDDFNENFKNGVVFAADYFTKPDNTEIHG